MPAALTNSSLSDVTGDTCNRCNCRNKDQCPLNGECRAHGIVYLARVRADNGQEVAVFVISIVNAVTLIVLSDMVEEPNAKPFFRQCIHIDKDSHHSRRMYHNASRQNSQEVNS
ncbi:uncharacterized protein LOC130048462 [Ostrea edulis]|uniref:uncharacterized protein LOC130048462 n=1 Tax=Ostrea edulis TaxID=37623 RepID=UPI0024AF98D0|nr:uncharacterized protein LOC130048462 [Ostrea edulis]